MSVYTVYTKPLQEGNVNLGPLGIILSPNFFLFEDINHVQ